MKEPFLVIPERTRIRGASERAEEGWNAPSALQAVDGREALAKRWPTDAHAFPVVIRKLDGEVPARQPRLRKSALENEAFWWYERPFLTWAFVDVDGVGHARETSDYDAQRRALREAVDGLPKPLGYTTRNGWRLAWPLEPSLDLAGWQAVAQAEGHLRGLRRRIARRYAGDLGAEEEAAAAVWREVGLRVPDGAWNAGTSAVTTSFRMPHVRRDGRDETGDLYGVTGAEPFDLRRIPQEGSAAGGKAMEPPPPDPVQGYGDRRKGAKRWAGVALDSEVARVSGAVEGTRHHTLFCAAANLGELVGGGVLDASDVEASLVMAGKISGLTPKDVARTVQDGLVRGARNPRYGPRG